MLHTWSLVIKILYCVMTHCKDHIVSSWVSPIWCYKFGSKTYLFKQFDCFDSWKYFFYCLKQIQKDSKMLPILDKAKNITIQKYCNILMNTSIIWFQYIFSMRLQSLWYWKKYRIWPKNDLLVLQNYSSFTEFIIKISRYFRTKRFNLKPKNPLIWGE